MEDFLELGQKRQAMQAPTDGVPELDPALRENIDAFCSQLDGLLSEHAGKYVVFANAKLVEVCGSLASALTIGYTNFAAGSFLVQRVEPLRSSIDFHATCRV
jgi:hypothetical protein